MLDGQQVLVWAIVLFIVGAALLSAGLVRLRNVRHRVRLGSGMALVLAFHHGSGERPCGGARHLRTAEVVVSVEHRPSSCDHAGHGR